MTYFKGFKTLEEIKKQYRELSKKLHPDLGGNPEEFKAMKNEFDRVINNFMAGVFDNVENSYGHDPSDFQDIINKIINFNMEIEIIGFWIYAKANSYYYKEDLKNLGFWFSKKHRAWVYSGTKKTNKASILTENQIKQKYGCRGVKQAVYLQPA